MDVFFLGEEIARIVVLGYQFIEALFYRTMVVKNAFAATIQWFLQRSRLMEFQMNGRAAIIDKTLINAQTLCRISSINISLLRVKR